MSILFSLLTIFLFFLIRLFLKIKYKEFINKNEKRNKILNLKELKENSSNLIKLNDQIGLLADKLNQHTVIVGGTGYGKTTTALSIIYQLAYKLNQTVIIIDGKGDLDLINKVKLIDKNAFIWRIGGNVSYNPFATLSPIMLADKIMSLFDFSESPYYRDTAHDYLLILLETLKSRNLDITLENIIKYFSVKSLKRMIPKDSHNYDYLLQFDDEKINGLLSRLNLCKKWFEKSIANNNSLKELVSKHKIILFSIDSLSYTKVAGSIGTLLIQDLKEFAKIKEPNKAINIVLDEFNVFASEAIINLINKTRSFNYQCFLCFQTISDLKTKGNDLTNIVFGNVSNLIAHKVIDPVSAEYIARLLGTRTNEKITKQLDHTVKTGRGSTREVEEYIAHPNDLKNLKVGEAYIKIQLPSSNQIIEKIKIKPYSKFNT